MKKLLGAFALSLSMLLAGCGVGNLADLEAKTKDVKTKEELVKVLGEPNRRNSSSTPLISGDIYEYDASDGVATFTILNGKVIARSTKSKKE